MYNEMNECDMDTDSAVNSILIALGAIPLYMAWPNAEGLLGLGTQCLPTRTRGVHLNEYYQLVYEDPGCTAYVYEGAYAYFLLFSLGGIALVASGIYRQRT
jgi:hypothetical protein